MDGGIGGGGVPGCAAYDVVGCVPSLRSGAAQNRPYLTGRLRGLCVCILVVIGIGIAAYVPCMPPPV